MEFLSRLHQNLSRNPEDVEKTNDVELPKDTVLLKVLPMSKDFLPSENSIFYMHTYDRKRKLVEKKGFTLRIRCGPGLSECNSNQNQRILMAFEKVLTGRRRNFLSYSCIYNNHC